VGYGKMWHPTARMSHYLSICVASCYFSINVTILRLLTFLLFVSTFFLFQKHCGQIMRILKIAAESASIFDTIATKLFSF